MGAPKYLFHWTTAKALDKIAGGVGPEGAFPLVKPIPADSVLHSCYPQLRRRPVLFAWEHPVTAMASNSRLIYAGAEPREARIVILAIKNAPKVLKLSTPRPCRKIFSIPADLDSIDLIQNEIRYENGVLVREWLILNPRAVKNYTADPSALKEFFGAEARKLKDPRRDYPKRAFHTRSPGLRRGKSNFFLSITSILPLRKSIVIPRLEALRRLKLKDIPPSLRRPLTIAAPSLRAWPAK
jgi:hypothetical protein